MTSIETTDLATPRNRLFGLVKNVELAPEWADKLASLPHQVTRLEELEEIVKHQESSIRSDLDDYEKSSHAFADSQYAFDAGEGVDYDIKEGILNHRAMLLFYGEPLLEQGSLLLDALDEFHQKQDERSELLDELCPTLVYFLATAIPDIKSHGVMEIDLVRAGIPRSAIYELMDRTSLDEAGDRLDRVSHRRSPVWKLAEREIEKHDSDQPPAPTESSRASLSSSEGAR